MHRQVCSLRCWQGGRKRGRWGIKDLYMAERKGFGELSRLGERPASRQRQIMFIEQSVMRLITFVNGEAAWKWGRNGRLVHHDLNLGSGRTQLDSRDRDHGVLLQHEEPGNSSYVFHLLY